MLCLLSFFVFCRDNFAAGYVLILFCFVMYLECFLHRESLWDRPPIGYETLTPMQYKAMRGTYMLIIKTFMIYIAVIYWHCHSAL